MKFRETRIPGVVVFELERRADPRGYFARVWCEQELRAHGLNPMVSQMNTGFSPQAGTLRGIHFQTGPHAEVKIVRCLRGAVFDVAVDLRRDSPTFSQWFGIQLTPDGGESLYVPEGVGHGYLTLEDRSEVMYLASRAYAADFAGGVRYDDPAFCIRWPRDVAVVSEADRTWPNFVA